ncbi:putative Chromosome partitioning protein ParA [Gammaproteobacteria bacterium]
MSRLILVHGDKGGVGKSTLARATLDYLYRRRRVPIVYDADNCNGQIYRFYKDIFPVKQLNIDLRGSFDEVLDKIAANKKASSQTNVFVDLPAQAGNSIDAALSELRLVEALDSIHARATLLFVIGRTKDSVNAIQIAFDLFGEIADLVVVKNEFFGEADRFIIYDASPTHQNIVKSGAKELLIPALWGDTYSIVDRLSLPFFRVAESNLQLSVKARISAWLNKFDAQFEKIDSWL